MLITASENSFPNKGMTEYIYHTKRRSKGIFEEGGIKVVYASLETR